MMPIKPIMENALSLSGILDAGKPRQRGQLLRVISISCSLIFLIGWVDYISGWELSVIVFYVIPILWVVLRDERRLSLILSILCSVVWWVANMDGHPYRSEWSYHWASMGRAVYFVLVALGGNAIRAKLKSDQTMIEALENMRRLEREIVDAGERERQRIGRDLHDGLCQQLVAIGFASRSLAEDLEARSLPEAQDAAKIEMLLRDSVVQARNLARGVFPVLSGAGELAVALDELALMTKQLTGMKVLFREKGDVHLDDLEVAMHLYRIAQEALNNALRHSHGSEVIISLDCDNESLRLSVADDGNGMPEDLGVCAGMGMKTMAYRAEEIGATLEIRRRSPQGTEVSCCYPISKPSYHEHNP